MIVSVIQEDIDSPVDPDERCKTCPVARAINRHLVPGLTASVVGIAFYIYRGAVRLNRYNLGPEVQAFVEAFDNGRETKPFDFEITIPKCFTV